MPWNDDLAALNVTIVDPAAGFGESVTHQRHIDVAARTLIGVWSEDERTEITDRGAHATFEALKSSWPATPQPGEAYIYASRRYEQVGPPRPATIGTWMVELKYLGPVR